MKRTDGTDEDGATTAKYPVEGIGDCFSVAQCQGNLQAYECIRYVSAISIHSGRAAHINGADRYGILLTSPRIQLSYVPPGSPRDRLIPNSCGNPKSGVSSCPSHSKDRPTRSVGSSLVPPLHCRSDGSNGDAPPEPLGEAPSTVSASPPQRNAAHLCLCSNSTAAFSPPSSSSMPIHSFGR